MGYFVGTLILKFQRFLSFLILLINIGDLASPTFLIKNIRLRL